MATLKAGKLATLVNAYTIRRQPKSITLSHATELAGYRDVTVTGTLVPRRFMEIQANGSTRAAVPPAGKLADRYPLQADGDVHFSIGTSNDAPHVACELQRAKGHWNQKINDSIGNQVIVAGFFRCLFEHPGFVKGADAHIFEIHPVRAIDFGDGQGVQSFDVGRPDPQSIHQWIDPRTKRNLNQEDAMTTVAYDRGGDRLTFSGMSGIDLNYVLLKGTVGNIQPKSQTGDPAQFLFASSQITNPITVYSLKKTAAEAALEGLKNGSKIELVALRNIDLAQAQRGRYVITLLAIDIKAA